MDILLCCYKDEAQVLRTGKAPRRVEATQKCLHMIGDVVVDYCILQVVGGAVLSEFAKIQIHPPPLLQYEH